MGEDLSQRGERPISESEEKEIRERLTASSNHPKLLDDIEKMLSLLDWEREQRKPQTMTDTILGIPGAAERIQRAERQLDRGEGIPLDQLDRDNSAVEQVERSVEDD